MRTHPRLLLGLAAAFGGAALATCRQTGAARQDATGVTADAQRAAGGTAAAPVAAEDGVADATGAAAEPPIAERAVALLEARCFKCHGPETVKLKGGLRMSGRDALLAGGDRGPALVPGEPEASRLVEAIRYVGSDLEMPPTGKLPEAEIELLTQWIAAGAPWPDSAGAAAAPATSDAADAEAERAAEAARAAAAAAWWAYQPIARPEPPALASDAHARLVASPIDAFVLARLESAGIEPAPPAERRELVRRAYFDLLGLPPSYDEVEAFAADDAPDAWERLIDRLLARPEHGERMARMWLDLVRFSQTNGYERDEEKPFAWRYRDWVVDAFARDLPYDRFLKEQIAGDELDDADESALVATGLYRVGAWDDEPDDPAQADYDELDDVVRTIGEGFLGTTLGCARCHDHKFDPISQADYTGVLAFVRSVRPYEKPTYSAGSPVLAPLGGAAELATWAQAREVWLAQAKAERRALYVKGLELVKGAPKAESAVVEAGAPSSDEKVSDAALIAALPPEDRLRLRELTQILENGRDGFAGDLEWALCVREAGAEPVPTHLLGRGRANAPREPIEPRFPPALSIGSEGGAEGGADGGVPVIRPPASGASTGRRRALAEWVARAENPLTARVWVNRLWRVHFARGIVATTNDFGRMGEAPTHPELLDWLASELMARGWSTQALQREILRSYTYRMSSRASAASPAADPENRLLGRQNSRRLEAEAIRDSMLLVSGELSLERGGRGFFPRLSREAMAGASRPGAGWGVSPPDEEARRSLYAYAKRGMLLPFFELFDCANPSQPTGERPVTTSAPQALTLWNGDFSAERAAALSRRVLAEASAKAGEVGAAGRVDRAFRLALSRPPSAGERQAALAYLDEQAASFAALRPTLAFAPRVPGRLDTGFLARAAPEDLMLAPRQGWRVLRGEWGNLYNDTLAPDGDRGPSALCADVDLEDGRVDLRLRFRPGCESFSLLVRAVAREQTFDGIEVRVTPRAGALLIAHAGGQTTTLGRADATLEPDEWHRVDLALVGAKVRVQIREQQPIVIEADDERLRGRGAFGVRVGGDALELDELVVRHGDAASVIPPEPAPPADERALEALCLALLNLNEFVYVD